MTVEPLVLTLSVEVLCVHGVVASTGVFNSAWGGLYAGHTGAVEVV